VYKPKVYVSAAKITPELALITIKCTKRFMSNIVVVPIAAAFNAPADPACVELDPSPSQVALHDTDAAHPDDGTSDVSHLALNAVQWACLHERLRHLGVLR
jgi:hypothetical protein